ncbi:MAG: GspE/PulE family protein [Candidatus Paceibacterota bacterium]
MINFNEKEQEKKLIEIRRAEEEDLAQILSQKYQIPYLDLLGIPVNPNALMIMPEEDARGSGLAIFSIAGKNISVALLSPENKKTSLVLEQLKEQGYKPSLFIVSRKSLEKVWDRYKELTFGHVSQAGVLDISNDDIEKYIKEIKTIDGVRDLIHKIISLEKNKRVTQVIEVILAGGLILEASDVHIEPEENIIKIRMRLDGVLINIADLDRETYKLLLSRIKLVSGLKISRNENSQDGRFSIRVQKNEIEIRTSTLPSEYGESIAMRILNPETIALPLEKLGMDELLMETVEKEIKKPNGMILNTGPTGSGKTTTLYALLKKIYTTDIKIITIEDPIEYHLPGITQTQVENEKGYTFGKGLVSSLRQDPDVIMVGEIRDKETAETAINASLTGHLVLSTLHTNAASGTFPRLIDLGVKPQMLGSSINLAMAQRLIRRLCVYCKKNVPTDQQTTETIKRILEEIKQKDPRRKIPSWDNKSVFISVGCEKCNQTGYKGRSGIFEAIILDENIEDIIRTNPSEREIEKAFSKQRILSMRQDGIIKVLEGITDMNELQRVIEL